MIKKLIFCVLFPMIITSCKKEHTIHIKAINPVTGAGYAGLSYSIKGSKTGIDGEKLVFTYNGTLNASGEDFPTFKLKENLTYHVSCTEPPNTCYTKNINFFWDVKADPNPTFQFEYAGCAYLKLDIENVNCQGSTDVMKFRSKKSYSEFEGWSGERIGCYSYTSPDYFEVEEGWHIYQWYVDRNGVITNYEDSIFLGVNGYGVMSMDY